MTDFTTATTNFDKTVQVGIQARILEELRGDRVLMADALQGVYVKGVNDTIRYIAYAKFPVVTGTPTPGTSPWLAEGVPPTPIAGTVAYDEMVAYQAGVFTRITDKAELESPHNLLKIYADLIALNAAETIEQRIADVIAADTNQVVAVFSGTGNTNTAGVAAGDIITGYDVKKAAAYLAAANVPRFPDGYYHSVIHPLVSHLGLMVDDDAGGWIDANKYTDNLPLLRGELGRYAGIRFMESTFAHVRDDLGTSSIDVYDTIVYGPQAWAFGDRDTVRAYFNTGPEKVSDPLNQIIATIGWKAFFGAKVLTAAGARYARIQSAGI